MSATAQKLELEYTYARTKTIQLYLQNKLKFIG